MNEIGGEEKELNSIKIVLSISTEGVDEEQQQNRYLTYSILIKTKANEK